MRNIWILTWDVPHPISSSNRLTEKKSCLIMIMNNISSSVRPFNVVDDVCTLPERIFVVLFVAPTLQRPRNYTGSVFIDLESVLWFIRVCSVHCYTRSTWAYASVFLSMRPYASWPFGRLVVGIKRCNLHETKKDFWNIHGQVPRTSNSQLWLDKLKSMYICFSFGNKTHDLILDMYKWKKHLKKP